MLKVALSDNTYVSKVFLSNNNLMDNGSMEIAKIFTNKDCNIRYVFLRRQSLYQSSIHYAAPFSFLIVALLVCLSCRIMELQSPEFNLSLK
jgi:hypothetical protein